MAIFPEIIAAHPRQAMLALLTTPDDTWPGGTIEDATTQQMPLANIALRILARGEKKDQVPALETPT